MDLGQSGSTRKVDALPDAGRCVIAHPINERHAADLAEEEGTPYLLRDVVPRSSVYIMDVDALLPGWLGGGAIQ